VAPPSVQRRKVWLTPLLECRAVMLLLDQHQQINYQIRSASYVRVQISCFNQPFIDRNPSAHLSGFTEFTDASMPSQTILA